MTDAFDMSEYLGVFLQEADEQLQTFEENLVKLEREGADPDLLQEIFRAAHTLKGASASMGFTQLADITHSLENVLDAMRNEVIKPTSETVDVMFRVLDVLRDLKEEIAAGQRDTVPVERVKSALDELKGILAQSDEPRSPAGPKPADSEDVVLESHDIETLRQAQEEGFVGYGVRVSLKAGCPLKGIRAALVVNELDTLGDVVKTIPGPEDLEEERFDTTFTAVCITREAPETLSAAVNKLSEIDTVVVEVISADSATRTAAKQHEAPPPPDADEDADADATALAPTGAGARAQDQAKGPSGTKQVQSVRVNVEQLDNLMNMVAELVIDRTMLEQIRSNLAAQLGGQDEHVSSLEEAVSGIRRRTTELQDEIMKARLLPIGNVFSRFPRMLRDLSQKAGKQIDFRVSGGETELDRSVLEYIADPLIHILRNSVDHGIESPADRAAAGKPAVGVIDLSARHQENHIVIDVTDDGRGIDPARVKAAALRKGVITEETASRMSERDALELIFASGTSTAEKITDVSGRGVGMDIVKTNIERLNGSVEIRSTVGVGTTMRVRLPLTLAIIQALMIVSRDRVFAVPLTAVEETERRPRSEVSTVQGRATIVVRDRVIPLLDLSGSLKYNSDRGRPQETGDDQIYIVIVSVGERSAGLVVDRLIGEQEVVIKSLGKFIGEVRGISGATILGDGTVALIADVGAILELAIESVQGAAV